MKRKVLKSIYCMAIMLLTLGTLSFVPMFKSNNASAVGVAEETDTSNAFNNSEATSADENQTEASLASKSARAVGGTWNSQFGTMTETEVKELAANVENSTVTRPDGTYHLIANVDDLAMVSYQILTGNTTWASYKYELTADLNLSGALWTPIGTASNPFKGTFYGGNRTISNISVATISTPTEGYAGLFGYTKGASASNPAFISNVIINGMKFSDSTSTTNAGGLIGRAGSYTVVSNAYMMTGSDITNGIGTAVDSTVHVYRGGSRDGLTAHYTTTAAIQNAFPVGFGSPTYGYAVTYIKNDGAIVKYSSRTSWDDTQYSYPMYGSNITTAGAVQDSFGFYGAMPTTRAAAMANQSGNFAIKQGYEHTFKAGSTTITSLTGVSTLASAGMLVKLSWATKNFNVTIHYGYDKNDETERTETRSVANDALWTSAITDASLTRVGYTLAGKYFNADKLTNPMDGGAGRCYVGDATGLSGGAYSLYTTWTAKTGLAYNVDLTNVASDTGLDATKAVSNFAIKEGSTNATLTSGTTYDYDMTGHTASNTVTITFKLNWGYVFNVGTDYTINSTKPTMATAGVYMVFGSGNYDTYAKTTYNTTKDANNNYTITLTNLVGSGQIYLAFDRAEQNITLDGKNVNWSLSGNTGKTSILDSTLKTRVDEAFEITATSTDPENFFITTYETSGIINSNGSSLGAQGSDELFNHYTKYKWTVTAFNSNMSGSETMYIKAYAGTLEVNINVAIIHDPDDYNGFSAEDIHTSAGATVVGSNNTTNSTTPATYRASLKNGAVEVFMFSNAYYRYSGLTGTSTNSSETVVFTDITEENQANGYVKHKASFSPVIKDNEGTPTYTIIFTAVPQEYSLESEIYIDGSLVVDKTSLDGYFSDYKSGEIFTRRPGTGLTGVAYTLSELGGKVLVFDEDASGVFAKDETQPGIPGILEGTTFTYGTTNTVIRMYYNSKKATINLSATAYIDGVNGTSSDLEWAGLIESFLTEAGAGIASFTGKINADGTAVEFSAEIGNVNIVNGYYFLGWYLKNGDVITKLTSNKDMSLSGVTAGSLLELLQNAKEVNSTVQLGAIIKQKVVNLSFVEGEDPNELISYKNDDHKTDDGSKVIELDYTYFHDQEIFTTDTGVYGNKTAFSFKVNNLDQLFKKVAAGKLTGYKVVHNDETTYFNDVNNNNFTTTNFDVVYGSAESVSLIFNPIFADLLSYEITIGNNVNGDTASINISLGDTIVMSSATNNGSVTYQVVRGGEVVSEITTSPIVGYSAVDSKLFTFAGNLNKTDKVTSFTLSEDVIKRYLPNTETDFYVGGTNPFTIETQLEAISYKIYLQLNSTYEALISTVLTEEDGRIYVEATYDKIMTNLQNVNVVRSGYNLSKWINTSNSDTVLEKNEGVWKDTIYKYDDNITVRPVWTADTEDYYINIDSIVGGEVYYNGQAQEVASVTLSTDKDGEIAATRATLGNGDVITSQYWAKKDDEDNSVQSSLKLSLTNVVESGEYVYVINVQSTTGLNAEPYRIVSAPVTVNIKKNAITVDGANVKGYYTGTGVYKPTSESNEGTLTFTYKNSEADGEIAENILYVSGYEFVAINNAYNAQTGYAVRYYIEFNGNEGNFEGYTVDESGAKYILVTNVGEIVKTTITFTVSGKGLYVDGMKHEVSYVPTNANVDLVKYGIVASASIMTNNSALGSYTDDAGFTVSDFSVLVNGTPATANFDYNVSGTYVIERASSIYNYTIEYLTASEGSINGLLTSYTDATYVLNVTAITVGGTPITGFANKSFFSYSQDGNVVLTIFGNGGGELNIAVNSTYSVGVTVQATAKTANDNLVFLGYYAGSQNYQTLMDEFTNPASTSTVINRVEGEQNVFAVFTDVKSITLDKGNTSETIYISAGEAGFNVANPSRDGLTFNGWDFADGSATPVAGEEKYKFVVNAGSTPATATAKWVLQEPTTDKTDETITKSASETGDSITLTEVIGSITNLNSTSIEYTYTWKKNGITITGFENSQSLVFDRLTTNDASDNGNVYTLEITATFGEQTTVTIVPFTLVVNKVRITSYVLSATTSVYNNSNYASSVNAVLNVGGSHKEFVLSTSLNNSSAIYFTINNGEDSVTAMKDVGSYSVTLNIDSTIYELASDLTVSRTFDITKASYTLKDFVLSKNFGAKTPAFETTVNVNGENITIYFNEITTEAVGEYPLSLKSELKNYNVVLENCVYKIVKLATNLRVSLNGTFTMVYNGRTVTVIDKEFTDGQWALVAKDANGELARVNITLYYENDNGQNVEVTTNLASALDGFTFSLTGVAKNVGDYPIAITGTSATYGGIELYGADNLKNFAITQATIDVAAVEKMFDETANFTWSSTQTSGLTTITATGIATGDSVTISGSLGGENGGIKVGTQNIVSLTLTDESGNYRLATEVSAKTATVVASDATIAISGTNKTFDYGTINETIAQDVDFISGLIKLALTANGNESNAFTLGYVTIASVSIGISNDYSTGRYLNKGKYTVTLTLTSDNYTGANGEFTNIEIEINAIGINLTSTTVTKEYDGTTDIVGADWIKTGMLAGDDVKVAGSYTSANIGTGIPLDLELTGDDAENYTISSQPTGSITSTAINFTANLNTVDGGFVDGEVLFPATKEFSITYNGDKDLFLSTLAQRYAEKPGYIQTAWTYGDNITVNSDNFNTFLAAALAANASEAKALTINAVWDRKTLTINILAPNATVKVGGSGVTSVVVKYYDNLTLEIQGNEGYRYSSYIFTGTSVDKIEPAGLTNVETLTLTNVTKEGTLTVTMTEIQINVKIDLSNAPEAANASAEWSSKNIGYTAAKAGVLTLLPIITTTEGTYVVDYWTNGDDTTAITDTTTLLSLVGGDVDKDSSVTLVAHFKAVALNLTIVHANADVTVTMDGKLVEGNESIYTVYYDADVIITITGKEGYKYAGESHEGIATSFTPNGVGKLNASLAISGIKETLTVTLTMAEIEVTIKADSNTSDLVNTAIVSEWTTRTLNYSALKDTVDTVLNKMTVAEGTYTQIGWTLDGTEITSQNLLALILEKKGSAITEDYTLEIAFKPVWAGVEYTITFDANHEEASITGTNPLTGVKYGSNIEGMPTAVRAGYSYSWNTKADGTGTSYSARGAVLRTPDASKTLTLYAIWTQKQHNVTVTVDSNIFEYRVNGEKLEENTFEIGETETVEITVTFKAGYELDTTATIISIGNVAFADEEIKISGVTGDATLNIKSTASTYKLVFDVKEFEKVTGDKEFVSVKYADALSTQLDGVVVTRAGYKFKGFTANGEVFASYDETSGYTFTNATYMTAGDTTLKAIWEAEKDYYKATFNETSVTKTYNGKEQEIATATVTGVDLTAGLTNGDEIVDYYFAKVDAESEVGYLRVGTDTTNILTLKNVRDTGEYVFVLVIKDSLTGETRNVISTDILATNKVNVTINKAELGWSDVTLESYYTGTNFYSATATRENGNAMVAGEATTDVTFVRFEFDAEGNVVGTGYDVRVYITIGASVLDNYSNVKGNATDGYYILLEGVGSVKASPIVITAKGKGYETGSKQVASYDVSTTITGLNIADFNVAITLTTEGTSGVQTSFTATDFAVTKAGSVVTDNFTYEISSASRYEIVEATDAYTMTISRDVLTNGTFTGNTTITLNNVKLGEETVVVSEGFFNYVDEDGEVIFSISGNGVANADVIIVVNNTYNLTFNATLTGNFGAYELLAWTETSSEEANKELLSGLTTIASRTKAVSVTADATLYYVITDLKAITVNDGDKGTTSVVYATVGGDTEFAGSEWTGFTLASWTCPTGVSVASGNITVEANATILPATITANWTIAKPNATGVTTPITITASEEDATISIDSVISTWRNKNAEELGYTYQWFNAKGESLGNGESLNIAAMDSSKGDYYVVITATKSGYANAISEHVEFTIAVTKATLSASTAVTEPFIYANKDFASEINITLNINGETVVKTLAELVNGEHIKMLINGGAGEIKNQGSYTVTLWSNDEIYDMTPFTTTIVVNKASHTITSDEVASLNKFYGEADPALEITLELNGETIKVTFDREEGEDVDFYSLTNPVSDNENYNITIAENNKFFEIKKTEGVLRIEVTNADAFTKEYNKKNTIFTADYADGKWTLYAFNEGDDTSVLANAIASSDLVLYTFNAGTLSPITSTEILANALTNTSFTITGDNYNAGGDYTIVPGANANYAQVAFTREMKFVVTKAQIVIKSVSKTFDKTTAFSSADNQVAFDGLVAGDNVVITGNFASVHASSDPIELTFDALTGSDANNYQIKNPEIKGTITASTDTVNFDIANKTFTYGNLKKGDDLTSVLGASLTIGEDYTTAIADGYVSIASVEVVGGAYSSTNNLKANTYTVKFVLNSTDYSNADGEKTFTIIVNKIELDLREAVVTKVYDGTPDLPAVTWDLSGVLAGDKVTITGSYDNANVGENKTLTLTTDGVDKDNYIVAYTPQGSITMTTVRLTVDAETLANFDVVDGELIDYTSTVFDVDYPVAENVDMSSVLNSLTYPTRTGFEVEYWSYVVTTGETAGYERITTANLKDVLDLAFANRANGGIKIYANWKKTTVDVELEVENATITVTTAGAVAKGNNVYAIPYFSNLEFTIKADIGYKFTNATITSGTISGGLTPNGVGTRNDGVVTLANVKTDSNITITTEELNITVKVNNNVPSNSAVESAEWNEKVYTFSQTNAEAVGLLPEITLTAGTYTLSGWSVTFGDKTTELTLESVETLMSILGNDLNEDTEITFNATWTGVKYTIYFDANSEDATITNGVTSITAEYGKPMTETFAEAEMSGKENVWYTADDAEKEGHYYKQNDVLSTIGTPVADGYTLTLYAIWSNAESKITVIFTDAEILSVTVGGEQITSGAEYTLVFGEDELNLTVTTTAGYTFKPVLTNDNDANVEIIPDENPRINPRTIKVSNVRNTTELTISALALSNTLTVNSTNSTITGVSVDGVKADEVPSEIVAGTGSVVEVEFTANAGYTFDEISTVDKTGSGNIARRYESGKLILTWSGFNADASVTITPTAVVNTITLGNSSQYADRILINNTSMVVSGDTFTATTGTELTISVVLKYGYENSNIVIADGENIAFVSGEEVWNDALKAFIRTFTISEYTDSFGFSVVADAREYTFNVAVDPAQVIMGSVSASTLTARFGESIILTATANTSYRFGGWYVGEDLISTANPYTFVLNEANKDYLESATPVAIRGEFTLDETNITIVSGIKGSLTYTVNGENEVTVATNSSVTRAFKYGNTLVITPKPERGYKVDANSVVFKDKNDNPITGKSWFDEDTGLITILLEVDAPARIEVNFVASEAIINVTTAVQINYQMSYGTDIAGTIYLSNNDGSVVYTDRQYYNTVEKDGVDYTVKGITNEKRYFVVRTNRGYSMTLSSPTLGVIINQTVLRTTTEYTETLFEISGIVDGMSLEAVFVGEDHTVKVYFVNGDNTTSPAPAGSISVVTSGSVVASGNNSSEVQISAVLNTPVTVDIYTNLSYVFVDDNGKPKTDKGQGFVSGYNLTPFTDVTNTKQTGFKQTSRLTIDNLDSNGVIYIFVEPKKYNVQFISNGEAMPGNSAPTILRDVVYGQSLPTFTPESVLPPTRSDYLFKGYYTKELGQGVQYVDEFGVASRVWLETGYTWNGVEYELDTAFYNEATNTFSLYAAWYYSKEKITISFIPEGLQEETDVTIADIVKPDNSQTPWWSTGDNQYYAEVPTDSKMTLTAYNFEGYTFAYWLIEREGEEPAMIQAPIYEYTSKTGDVFIKAVYFANFNIEVYDNGLGQVDDICGQATFMQDGKLLTDGVYDTTKLITLVATENAGYKFLGWLDLTTGEYLRDESGNLILGEYSDKTYKYTLSELVSTPINLRAVFEGAEIGIMIDLSEFSGHGRINAIRVNGANIGWASEIEARVGDTIEIDITTNYGYGVTWSGAIFTGTNGVYSYRIYARDLTTVAGSVHENVLIVKPVANPDPVTYSFDLQVEGISNSSELELVGGLVYRPESLTITSGSTITTLFGNTVTINVNMRANYKIGQIKIVVNGIRYDISNTYVEAQQQIILTSDILERYMVSGEAQIIIDYARLIWTDFRSEKLEGEGTANNPFMISSCEDMAFLAYAVNNGLVSESGVAYTDAYYKVTRDLDFTGKYWIPIGTQNHPFNGIIYLDTFKITGITHYMTYVPGTYCEGLIWFMTERAQVITSNSNLVIALSITGGILLLLILIIIIIVIARKRKKKKMEELANS